jgi:peptidoglycan-associated lipoprotein
MIRHPIHAALGAVALVLAACSSTPVTTPAAPQPMAAQAAAPVTPAPAPMATATPTPAASTVKTVTLPPYLDPRSSLSTARSVYFDYDDAALKPEFNGLVELHGKYLAANPTLAIRVEGNTDDRGSAEYNLALGQKRALVLMRALKIYGVRDTQVEVVSWGEEKPKVTGHDESAWAQNRRADLRYPAK